jgi:hypothetical protein
MSHQAGKVESDADLEVENESQQEISDGNSQLERVPGKRGRIPGQHSVTTVTEARLQTILNALDQGASVTSACDLADISVDSLNKRMMRDPEVARAVKAARARAELFHLAKIRAGGQGWQASAWYLERARGYTVDKKPDPAEKQAQPVQVQLVVVFGQGEAKDKRKAKSQSSSQTIDV